MDTLYALVNDQYNNVFGLGAVFLPVGIGLSFYVVKYVAIWVFNIARNPWHDPRPMRIWTVVSLLNAVFALNGIYLLQVDIGCVLIFVFYVWTNSGYGINI